MRTRGGSLTKMNIKLLYQTLKTTKVNIKGMELALGTIITLVLVLIVMAVLLSFFIGGSKETLTPISAIGKESGKQLEDAFQW